MDPLTVQAIREAAMRLQDDARSRDQRMMAELAGLVSTLVTGLHEQVHEDLRHQERLTLLIERQLRLYLQLRDALEDLNGRLDVLEAFLPEEEEELRDVRTEGEGSQRR